MWIHLCILEVLRFHNAEAVEPNARAGSCVDDVIDTQMRRLEAPKHASVCCVDDDQVWRRDSGDVSAKEGDAVEVGRQRCEGKRREQRVRDRRDVGERNERVRVAVGQIGEVIFDRVEDVWRREAEGRVAQRQDGANQVSSAGWRDVRELVLKSTSAVTAL